MRTIFDKLRASLMQGARHRKATVLAAGLLVAVTVGYGMTHASKAGTLDSTFGAANQGTLDGIVGLSLGKGNDHGHSIAVQADGKIVVAGNNTGSSTSQAGKTSHIVVQRFNTDGTQDLQFGAGAASGSPDGVVSLNQGSSTDVAHAVKIQADGKIVLAGTSTAPGGRSKIILARLNTNGTPDTSFGARHAHGKPNGIVHIDPGSASDEVARALAIQADGKIVVAGTSSSGEPIPFKSAMLARVNSDGSLDVRFGAGDSDGTPDGMVSASFSEGDDETNAIALQSDGKILIAGTTLATDGSTNAVVARFNTDGTPDARFGTGSANGTPHGVVSTSFSSGNDAANAIAVQTDGKILLAGTAIASDRTTNVVVARLNPNGTLDRSFGAGSVEGMPEGVLGISVGNDNDTAYAIAVQADGKIIVAGSTIATDHTTQAVVVRLHPDGKLDSRFGAGRYNGPPEGVVALSMSAGDDMARAVVLQADGKILVAGHHTNKGAQNMWVARLLSDG